MATSVVDRKPICVRYAPEVSPGKLTGLWVGLKEVRKDAGISEKEMEVYDAGNWADSQAPVRSENGILIERASSEWFVRVATSILQRDKSIGGYLSAVKALDLLSEDPKLTTFPHYPILVVAQPLYRVYKGENDFGVGGMARVGLGAVITFDCGPGRDDAFWYDYGRLIGAHELGHVFGLIPEERAKNKDQVIVEDYSGVHCGNECVMRFGIDVKFAIKEVLDKRLFCDACQRGLLTNFHG